MCRKRNPIPRAARRVLSSLLEGRIPSGAKVRFTPDRSPVPGRMSRSESYDLETRGGNLLTVSVEVSMKTVREVHADPYGVETFLEDAGSRVTQVTFTGANGMETPISLSPVQEETIVETLAA